jgi:hypothetical protein
MEASDYNPSDNASTNGFGESPLAAHEAAAAASAHPEIPVVGALVGGFVLAKILKALGGGDE